MRRGPDVGAIVACVDPAGQVLVVKQTTGPFAGAWLMPGGLVERGERPEDAARRELFEETGYRVSDLAAVALYEVRSATPGGFHIVLAMFRGGQVEGTPRPEPLSAVRWADPGTLDLHPSMAMQLADLGLIDRDRAELLRELAGVGVDLRRLF